MTPLTLMRALLEREKIKKNEGKNQRWALMAVCFNTRRRMKFGVNPPYATYASKLVRLVHPGWDIALAMQHTPHVDVIAVLGIEDQMGVTRQRPKA